ARRARRQGTRGRLACRSRRSRAVATFTKVGKVGAGKGRACWKLRDGHASNVESRYTHPTFVAHRFRSTRLSKRGPVTRPIAGRVSKLPAKVEEHAQERQHVKERAPETDVHHIRHDSCKTQEAADVESLPRLQLQEVQEVLMDDLGYKQNWSNTNYAYMQA